MTELLKKAAVCGVAIGLPQLLALLIVERWRTVALLILTFWGGMAYEAYCSYAKGKELGT